MLSNLFLIAGVVVLGFALRSFDHRVFYRLGVVCFGAAIFLFGWLVLGHLVWGMGLTVAFFGLPLAGILTETAALRLATQRKIASVSPPAPPDFPNLGELTDAIEAEGFEYCADIGNHFDEESDSDDDNLFCRVFLNPEATTQASICLVDHAGISFFYVVIASYLDDKRTVLTSNYPFPETLKFSPRTLVQRMVGTLSVSEQVSAHRQFLSTHSTQQLLHLDAEAVGERFEREFADHINYNVSIGLLRPAAEGRVRYTLKGLLFLCRQFIRDFFCL